MAATKPKQNDRDDTDSPLKRHIPTILKEAGALPPNPQGFPLKVFKREALEGLQKKKRTTNSCPASLFKPNCGAPVAPRQSRTLRSSKSLRKRQIVYGCHHNFDIKRWFFKLSSEHQRLVHEVVKKPRAASGVADDCGERAFSHNRFGSACNA